MSECLRMSISVLSVLFGGLLAISRLVPGCNHPWSVLPNFPPGVETNATRDTRTQPFRNAGASCYINATLQAFFGLSEIRGLCADILRTMSHARRNTLLRADHRCVDDAVLPQVNPEGPLDGDVLLAITMHANELSTRSLYPELFLHRVFWQPGIHEDAHETCFLKLLDSAASEARQLRHIFQGECVSFLKCPNCSHSWCISQDDERIFVALDIPTHDGARSNV